MRISSCDSGPTGELVTGSHRIPPTLANSRTERAEHELLRGRVFSVPYAIDGHLGKRSSAGRGKHRDAVPLGWPGRIVIAKQVQSYVLPVKELSGETGRHPAHFEARDPGRDLAGAAKVGAVCPMRKPR